jgi:nicotinate dehydrogenase subunit A
MAEMRLTVNGQVLDVEADPDSFLLYVLRDQLHLNGPKFGCGLSQCGSCMVLVDGQAIPSCQAPLSEVSGKEIVTLEGLGTEEHPGPLQQAFIDEQAAQCAYCSNGMIVTAQALLLANPSPSAVDVRDALTGVLCRCGAHGRIVRAVLRAAGEGATA